MRRNIKYYFTLAILLSVGLNCTKYNITKKPKIALFKRDSTQVELLNMQVINGPGKVTIKYTLPDSSTLLFVKAVYDLPNGEKESVIGNVFVDSLILTGFKDTLNHEIKIYTVNRSGVESLPIIVLAKPKTSPINEVFKSLKVVDFMDGYMLTAKNPYKASIGIGVILKQATNQFTNEDNKSIFTDEDSIVSIVTDLDASKTYQFGFYVVGEFGLTSDTLFKTIKPSQIQELSTSKFKAYPLPGDATENPNVIGVEGLWDGDYDWPNVSFTWADGNQPNEIKGEPHMISFDLGVMAKLSKVWIRPYPESGDRYYFNTTMKNFEIWGSDNPSSSGKLDNTWHLLGQYSVIKPSGLPYGEHNQEDVQTAEAGFNWDIDLNAPPVHFIRIKCLENFKGGNQQSISELKVFGVIK